MCEVVYSYSNSATLIVNDEGNIFEVDPSHDDRIILKLIAWDEAYSEAKEIWKKAKSKNLRGFFPELEQIPPKKCRGGRKNGK